MSSGVSATLAVTIREIRPPKWSCAVPLYRRPLTHTKVTIDNREMSVRLASGFLINHSGDYDVQAFAHPSGRFAVATALDMTTDPGFAGGIRMRHHGLLPTPDQLAMFGYTKEWLQEEIGGDDHRRAKPRHLTFGFQQADLWWTDPNGNIVTRLLILGCPVHLIGIKSVEEWTAHADKLTVVLLGDRPHALAFVPKKENGTSRITRVEEDRGGVAHLELIDPTTVADSSEAIVDELREEFAALMHLKDDEGAQQVGGKIQRLSYQMPLATPQAITSQKPSAAMLARIKASATPKSKSRGRMKSPAVVAKKVQVPLPDPSAGHTKTRVADLPAGEVLETLVEKGRKPETEVAGDPVPTVEKKKRAPRKLKTPLRDARVDDGPPTRRRTKRTTDQDS